METFLIDRDTAYSYDTLLTDINGSTTYCPLYKAHDLYHYFLNLIQAIVSGKPLVLVDSDAGMSHPEELSWQLNIPVPILRLNFTSMSQVLSCMRQSASQISIYTSGTTGQPKKVMHSIENLTRSVRVAPRYSDQVWAFAYNPTHMAGLQVFFQAFQNGNTLINVFNFPRQEVYQAISKYHITHISATPTFYRLLMPVENTFPFVQHVTLGGERSDPKLYDSILKIFPLARLTNIYASTEAGSLFAANGDSFHIPASIADKIKVDEDELLIHKSLLGTSPHFVFSEDYYRTGDLVEWVDKDQGLFRFKSRKNELINVGGYKVNPSEVETMILQLPDILQTTVYGKQNSVLGNILCAEVRLTEGSNLTEHDIRSFLAPRLQDFKIPRRINFVETFSLTRTGKTKRV